MFTSQVSQHAVAADNLLLFFCWIPVFIANLTCIASIYVQGQLVSSVVCCISSCGPVQNCYLSLEWSVTPVMEVAAGWVNQVLGFSLKFGRNWDEGKKIV